MKLVISLPLPSEEETPPLNLAIHPAMACRGFFEGVLKLLNLVVMAVGLAMAGYGAYLLVLWLQVLPPSPSAPPSVAPSGDLVRLGRPMLLLIDVSLSDGTTEKLSGAWYVVS